MVCILGRPVALARWSMRTCCPVLFEYCVLCFCPLVVFLQSSCGLIILFICTPQRRPATII